jgi:hypothetical protein
MPFYWVEDGASTATKCSNYCEFKVHLFRFIPFKKLT